MDKSLLSYLTLLTTCITIVTVIWKVSSAIVRRLVMIQRKLDALKGVINIIVSHLDSLNSYLVAKHGMGDRTSVKELIQAFVDQFNKSEEHL